MMLFLNKKKPTLETRPPPQIIKRNILYYRTWIIEQKCRICFGVAKSIDQKYSVLVNLDNLAHRPCKYS